MKKALIFVLLALIAKPAYPVFGASTLLQWGNGALSSMVSRVQEHPWLAGTVVSAVALGAAWLYMQRSEKLAAKEISEVRSQQKNDFEREGTGMLASTRVTYGDTIAQLKLQYTDLSLRFTEDEKNAFHELSKEAVSKISQYTFDADLEKSIQGMKDLLKNKAQKELEAEIAALKEFEKEIENANNDGVKEFFNTSIAPVIAALKFDEHSTLEELEAELTLVKELHETIKLMIQYDKKNELDKIEQLLDVYSSKHSENVENEFSLDGFQL